MTTLPTPQYLGAALTNQNPMPKPTTFPFDALRPAPATVQAFSGPASTFAAACATILAQVAQEDLKDFAVLIGRLAFRPTDGALTTDPVKGSGLAMSRHACSQMANILFHGRSDKPRDLTQNYAARGSMVRGFAARAAMLRDDVAGSLRPAQKQVKVRTCLTVVNGHVVRMARAFVSLVHAGKFTDDTALLNRLAQYVRPDAQARMTRTNDLSYGFATVGAPTTGLIRTLHWTNSETGCASLSVGAGAVLRLVDAVVQFPNSRDVIDYEEVVTLADKRSRASMRHTVPGGTDAAKETECNRRMDAMIQNALAYGNQLEAAWMRALVDVTEELRGLVGRKGADVAQEVLLDAVEGRFGMDADDRKALAKVLTDDKRLAAVTHGSAAHIAAAFAVLGSKAGSMAEAERLQGIAGQWVMRGWKN